jgi:hypothetical protein
MNLKGFERTQQVLRDSFRSPICEITPQPTEEEPDVRYVRVIVYEEMVDPHTILNALNKGNLMLRHGDTPSGDDPSFVHVNSTAAEPVPDGYRFSRVILEDANTKEV